MRYTLTILILFLPLLVGLTCENGNSDKSADKTETVDEKDGTMSDTIKITVAGKTFIATLLDNETSRAFKSMLPLTVVMSELNGNEKYSRLSKDLPVKASNIGTINSGDLMLYGSNTLVLFYETFPTSYSYTRLGKIENATGLASALGSGNVSVIFEQL